MNEFLDRRTKQRNRAKSIQAAIWLIGIGILALTDFWWPGIIFLVGISMIVGAVMRKGEPELETMPETEATPKAAAMAEEAPAEPARSPTPQPAVEAEPIPAPSPEYGWDWLPTNCPRCGAPLTSQTVKRLNDVTAQCSYCGSAMKKEA